MAKARALSHVEIKETGDQYLLAMLTSNDDGAVKSASCKDFLKVYQQKETRRRNHLLSKKKCLYRSKEDRVCVSIITGPIG